MLPSPAAAIAIIADGTGNGAAGAAAAEPVLWHVAEYLKGLPISLDNTARFCDLLAGSGKTGPVCRSLNLRSFVLYVAFGSLGAACSRPSQPSAAATPVVVLAPDAATVAPPRGTRTLPEPGVSPPAAPAAPALPLLAGIPAGKAADARSIGFCEKEREALRERFAGLSAELARLPPGILSWNDEHALSSLEESPADGGIQAEPPERHADALAALLQAAAPCLPLESGAWAVRPGSLVRTHAGDMQLGWTLVYAPLAGNPITATADPPQDAVGRALGPLALPAFTAIIDDPFYVPSRVQDDGTLQLPAALASFDFDGDGQAEAILVERSIERRVFADSAKEGPKIHDKQSSYVSIWTVRQGEIRPYAARWHRAALRVEDTDHDGRPDLILGEPEEPAVPMVTARSQADGSFVIEPAAKAGVKSAGLCHRATARTQATFSAIARLLGGSNPQREAKDSPRPAVPRASIGILQRQFGGACADGAQDAWALVLQGIRRLGERDAGASFALVHLAADGTTTARKEAVDASLACSQWLRARCYPYDADSYPSLLQAADFDGDGTTEALLTEEYRHRDEEPEHVNDKTTLTLWRMAAGQIVPVAVPGIKVAPESSADIDGDGRLDLIYYPYSTEFFSGCGAGYSYLVRGPALLIHATGDAQQPFRLDDEVALRFARKSCPHRPRAVVVGSGKAKTASFSWSPTETAENVACARLWGVPTKKLLQDIARKCPGPDSSESPSCDGCENSEHVARWAEAEPPLRLDTGPGKDAAAAPVPAPPAAPGAVPR